MSDIDWSETEYLFALINSDKGLVEFFEYKPSTSNCEGCWMVSNSETLYLKGPWEFIERPLYTKEFRVLGGSNEVWQKCKIVFKGKRYTVVENENGKEFSRKTAKIKIRDIDTRTDEEKAIADFHCYGFGDGLTALASKLALDLVKAGKIHNVTWGNTND